MPLWVAPGHCPGSTPNKQRMSLPGMSATHRIALHAGAYFLKADVRCEGANKVYTRRADSGFDAHFHFCPGCGTSVYWRLDRLPEFVGIAVGCFVEPDFPLPQWSGWEEVMHPWLSMPASIERFPQGIGGGLAARVAA